MKEGLIAGNGSPRFLEYIVHKYIFSGLSFFLPNFNAMPAVTLKRHSNNSAYFTLPKGFSITLTLMRASIALPAR